METFLSSFPSFSSLSLSFSTFHFFIFMRTKSTTPFLWVLVDQIQGCITAPRSLVSQEVVDHSGEGSKASSTQDSWLQTSCTHTHTHMCTHTHTHTCAHTHTHKHTHRFLSCTHTHTHTHTFSPTNAHRHTYAHTPTNTHTHTPQTE